MIQRFTRAMDEQITRSRRSKGNESGSLVEGFPMHSRFIVALALVAIPACAFAQKGRIATDKSPSDPPLAPTVRYPTVRDVEDNNPTPLLVDKRKKLALTDSSVAQLKSLEKIIKARNAPTLAMYDSVRRKIVSSLALDATNASPTLQ